MAEEYLSKKAREALKHIRNSIMQQGRVPTVRELMISMNYKSPRSSVLLMEELQNEGFLERKNNGGFRLIKDLKEGNMAVTVTIPLVGSVTCGAPMIAEENIEAWIPVSTAIAKTGYKYFLLKARGDSMDKAGIQDGDLILIRQQPDAHDGQNVVALIDDEATVKEFRHKGEFVTLVPNSTNNKHQPIILTKNFQIQGIVVATIPKI